MRERIHDDHGPLCALMKAHVDADDDHEVNYGDEDPSRMYVGDDHEALHLDEAPCHVVVMAHVHALSWHGALLSSMKSVGEDPWRALRMDHVPWHFDVVALSMKMEHVDEDSSHALRMAHVLWHLCHGVVVKSKKSVDDDPHDVQGHSWCGTGLCLKSHSMPVHPPRWGT